MNELFSTPPRLAASNYSNSAPLIWDFWHGSRRFEVDLTTDAAPARCAEMLRRGEAEIALTPVIEFQRIADAQIIPAVCVGSKKQVKSVILATRGDEIKSAKSVALDVSSKTSVALTEIVFREFFGRNPDFVPHTPDVEKMLETADAALLIGDPALRVDQRKFRVFDIVELWRELTGCGFVFAVWLTRSAENAGKIDFAAARDEGLRNVEEIIDFYAANVPLERTDFRRYLTENISYTLDKELLAGLEIYFRLAHKLGLINELKPLEFTA